MKGKKTKKEPGSHNSYLILLQNTLQISTWIAGPDRSKGKEKEKEKKEKFDRLEWLLHQAVQIVAIVRKENSIKLRTCSTITCCTWLYFPEFQEL